MEEIMQDIAISKTINNVYLVCVLQIYVTNMHYIFSGKIK